MQMQAQQEKQTFHKQHQARRSTEIQFSKIQICERKLEVFTKIHAFKPLKASVSRISHLDFLLQQF